MTRTAVRNHLRVARVRLQEAGVPPTALRPADLLAFKPEQWGLMIKLARCAHLARLAEAARNPVRRFVEVYRRERDVWPL